jgi:4-hydroxy-3-polyprenylbenzoate decarboxylase
MQEKNNIYNKILLGITGASGVIYGIQILKTLRSLQIESHLIISQSARLTIAAETDFSLNEVMNLADYSYNPTDIGARISSGSFYTDGMIIAPCSMKTVSAIASGYDEGLIARAANVTIKEQRKLVLMVRETPLSAIHLENMLKLSRLGIAICPPVPAFYNRPCTIDDLITHSVARILDLFNINTAAIKRWDGIKSGR